MYISKAEYDRRKAAIKAKIAPTISTVVKAGLRKSIDGEDVIIVKENISLSKYIRGGLFGIWKNADTEKSIFKKNKDVAKALGETSESRGGLFVPDVVSSVLIPRLQATSVLSSLGVSTTPISGFKRFSYPVQGTAPTITHDGESSTLTADDNKDYDKGTIDTHRMSCLVYTSYELMQDADIDMEAEVTNDIADQIALDQDAQVFRGLGGNEALGMLYQPRVNSTDLSGEIDQDDISNACYQVRKADGIINSWVGDPATAWKLAKLKDAEGRYLYPQTGNIGNVGEGIMNLGGKPLYQTTQIGVGTYPGANETYLVGGNWSRYKVLDGQGLIVLVSQEGGEAWTKGQIGIRVMKHFGAGPMLPETFVVIKGITGI